MERPFVDQFGFDVVTCCGYLPQVSDTSALPSAFQSGRLLRDGTASPLFMKFSKSLCSLLLFAGF